MSGRRQTRPPATTAAALRNLGLPAFVGVVLPLLAVYLDPREATIQWAGVVLLAIGCAIVASTVRDFFRHGRGTLAPWNPPRRLVTVGLFARCRNPMYVGVLTIAGGWAILFSSPVAGVYTALLAVAFHLRVLLHEEPWAARSFPDDWPRYREHVPRWWPRLRPWRPGASEQAPRVAPEG